MENREMRNMETYSGGYDSLNLNKLMVLSRIS